MMKVKDIGIAFLFYFEVKGKEYDLCSENIFYNLVLWAITSRVDRVPLQESRAEMPYDLALLVLWNEQAHPEYLLLNFYRNKQSPKC